MTKAEEELKKEGAQEATRRIEKRNDKLIDKLKNGAQRKIERAKEAPNGMHLTVGFAAMGAGTFGGFKANRMLRNYTADWLDEEGNRTVGATMLADVMPPVLGAGLVALSLAFTNGAAVAATAGAGAGVTIGSLVSTALVG